MTIQRIIKRYEKNRNDLKGTLLAVPGHPVFLSSFERTRWMDAVFRFLTDYIYTRTSDELHHLHVLHNNIRGAPLIWNAAGRFSCLERRNL